MNSSPVIIKNKFSKETPSFSEVVICLVEDDATATKVYRRWLEELGATICSFSNFADFQEALTQRNGTSLLKKKQLRIALTDFILPDASGLDVVSLWHKTFPQFPIIVLTAFATVENAVDAMRQGAFDFLRKPIRKEDLNHALMRAYEHALLLEENETLSLSVRMLSMAQNLSEITDRFSLLRFLGPLLLRETKSQETYVFYFEAKKAYPDFLIDKRQAGLSRTPPEVIYSQILLKFLEKREQDIGERELDLSTTLDAHLYEQPEDCAVILELRSQTGNSGCIILINRENYAALGILKTSLQPIVRQAARTFQNTDVATALSFVDDLTGLYNQRFLLVTLKNEVARAARYGTPLSLLFFDLDKFKQINDNHGHIVGSQILRESSGIFRANVRDCDYLLRYGGDEFVAILPNTPLQGAVTVAERIREAFEAMNFDVREKTGVTTAHLLNVTTSIGIATFPNCATDPRELIQCADDAMYESKHTGRNRVTIGKQRDTPL